MNALYLGRRLRLARSLALLYYLVAHFDAAPSHSSLFLEQVLKPATSQITLASDATFVIIADSSSNKDSATATAVFLFLAKKSLGFPASFSLLVPTTSLVS